MMTTDGSERRDECPRGREVGARRRGVDRDGRARGPDDDGTARRERWRRGIVESIHRRRTRWAMVGAAAVALAAVALMTAGVIRSS